MNWLKIKSLLIILFICGCSNNEDISPDSTDSQLQGTWLAPNPTYQYLDENDRLLYEEPFGELQGEITLKNKIITIIEPDGNVYSGTYITTQASGKDFIVVTINGDTETLEVNFLSKNEMIMTGFERSDTGYVDKNEEEYTYYPAAKSRFYSLLTRK